MYFNEYFDINIEKLNEYGALNISLDNDLPLFIDPILIFVSKNKDFANWHTKLIKYMLFLYNLKEKSTIPSDNLIRTYFTFKEICNNWLGLSTTGNKGSAIGYYYGVSLFNNIGIVTETHNVSKSIHLEKLCLLQDGSGKDKISDFVVNILLAEFAKYTERFAVENISRNKLKTFKIEKGNFNFENNQFVPCEYTLPYIINEKGKCEYVLLTPKEFLRVDENAINKENFYQSFDNVLECIDNAELRTRIMLHINNTIKALYDAKRILNSEPTEKEKRENRRKAIDEMVRKNPEILDYFIKLQEDSGNILRDLVNIEVNSVEQVFINNAKELAHGYFDVKCEHESAYDEALYRINFFKNEIEECGLWRTLYVNQEPIKDESDLQRMFRLVWCRTNFDFNSEVNNGNGPIDFKVSKGFYNKKLVEFKLAKNSKLQNVFAQTSAYEKANRTNNSIVVIFYFNLEEKKKVEKLINDYNGNKK